MVAKITLTEERPPSEVEAKIKPAILENSNTREISTLLWRKQIEKYPHEEHGHANGWAEAKSAVAQYV